MHEASAYERACMAKRGLQPAFANDTDKCVGERYTPPDAKWFDPLDLKLADCCEDCSRRSTEAGFVYIAPAAELRGGDWHCRNRRCGAGSVCATEPARQSADRGGGVASIGAQTGLAKVLSFARHAWRLKSLSRAWWVTQYEREERGV